MSNAQTAVRLGQGAIDSSSKLDKGAEYRRYGDMAGASQFGGDMSGVRGKEFRKELRDLRRQKRRGTLTGREADRLAYLKKIRGMRLRRDIPKAIGTAAAIVFTAGGAAAVKGVAGAGKAAVAAAKAAKAASAAKKIAAGAKAGAAAVKGAITKKAALKMGQQVAGRLSSKAAQSIAKKKMKEQQKTAKDRALRAMEYGDFAGAQRIQAAGSYYTPGLESFIPLATQAAMKGLGNLDFSRDMVESPQPDPAPLSVRNLQATPIPTPELQGQDKKRLRLRTEPLIDIPKVDPEITRMKEQLDEMGGIPTTYSGSGSGSVVPQLTGQQVDLSAMLPPPPAPTPPVNIQPLSGRQPTLIPTQNTQPALVSRQQDLPPTYPIQTELKDVYYDKYDPDTSPSVVTENYESMSDDEILQSTAPARLGNVFMMPDYEEGTTTMEEYVNWLKDQDGYDGDYAKALSDAKQSFAISGRTTVDIDAAEVGEVADFSGTWTWVENPNNPGTLISKEGYESNNSQLGTWRGKYPSYDQVEKIPYPQTVDEFREWFKNGHLRARWVKSLRISKYKTFLQHSEITEL